MADMLDKNEQHLFLEKYDNGANSFIANVNKLAGKIDSLIELNIKLTPEQIDILTKLADIGADTLAEDLEKGSESGYRKLDIDLLKNFAAYNRAMSDDEKRELWADVTAQVYYEAVTVAFKDKTSIYKKFEIDGVGTPIRNHHQLYDQFNEWSEFKAKYGYTLFNIAPDTVLHNHELLRFLDGQGNGSTIDYIILHVAPQGQNLNYDASFQGAKEHDVKYTWVNTTSVLLTICNDLASLLTIANTVEDLRRIHAYLSDLTDVAGNLPILVTDPDSIRNNLGKIQTIFENMSMVVESSKYVTEIQNAQAKIEEVSEQITADKETINTFKNRVESLSNELKDLTATATTLTSDQDATAQYDAVTGVLTIGIPKGPIGLKGNDGQDGKDGRDGADGRDGLPPDHRWVGTALQFRNSDGTWGSLTELKIDQTPPATEDQTGLVKASDTIRVDEDGTLHLNTASDTQLGGIRVGKGLSINENGVLSSNVAQLPTATKTDKGVIKVGAGLQIDENGVLSTKEIDIATTDKAGIVKPDIDTMIVDEEGLLKDKKEFGYFESMPEGGLPTEDFKKQAYAIVDDGEEVGTLDRIANEVAKRLTIEPIGKVDFFARTQVPEGWLVCDGSEVSKLTYQSLYTVIGAFTEDGEEEGTFKLPNLIGKYLCGGLADNVGIELKAGLPNIEGSYQNANGYTLISEPKTGAFSGNGQAGTRVNWTAGSSTGNWGGASSHDINFDASNSNSIYGNSDTVTPPSLVLLPCIKAFNVISDADNLSITNLAQELVQFRKFIEEKSTIIYPNNGTKDNPANITANQRYEMDNPYSGYFVYCEPQIQVSGQWGNPCAESLYTSAAAYYGIEANQLLPDDKIIVRSLMTGVAGDSRMTGQPFYSDTLNLKSAPCRVIVTRLGKIPTE